MNTKKRRKFPSAADFHNIKFTLKLSLIQSRALPHIPVVFAQLAIEFLYIGSAAILLISAAAIEVLSNNTSDKTK